MTGFGSTRCHRVFVLVTALVGCVVIVAAAAEHCLGVEVVLQNDSLAAPGTGNVLNTFLPGERAASWFTAPDDGDIVGLQVFWVSMFGSAPDQIEMAITVSTSGVFPSVGAAYAQILGPTLVDGSDNEFRYTDPGINSVPIQVPVVAGESFSIDIEFLNQSSGNLFAPSIETDNDGTVAGAQSVFVLPGGWMDANPLGIQGDFAIRAIFEYAPAPGDGNNDGHVDGLDYLLWAGNYGTHPGPDGDVSDGDYNDDGWIDGLDYLSWAGNYAQGPLDAFAVPEPATWTFFVVHAVVLLSYRRKQNGQERNTTPAVSYS